MRRLVPILEDWRSCSAAVFLFYPTPRQVAAPLQAFIDFLRRTCGRVEARRHDASRASRYGASDRR